MMVKYTSEAKLEKPKVVLALTIREFATYLLLKYLYGEKGEGVRGLGVNYPYCWLSSPAHAFRGGLLAHTHNLVFLCTVFNFVMNGVLILHVETL